MSAEKDEGKDFIDQVGDDGLSFRFTTKPYAESPSSYRFRAEKGGGSKITVTISLLSEPLASELLTTTSNDDLLARLNRRVIRATVLHSKTFNVSRDAQGLSEKADFNPQVHNDLAGNILENFDVGVIEEIVKRVETGVFEYEDLNSLDKKLHAPKAEHRKAFLFDHVLQRFFSSEILTQEPDALQSSLTNLSRFIANSYRTGFKMNSQIAETLDPFPLRKITTTRGGDETYTIAIPQLDFLFNYYTRFTREMLEFIESSNSGNFTAMVSSCIDSWIRLAKIANLMQSDPSFGPIVLDTNTQLGNFPHPNIRNLNGIQLNGPYLEIIANIAPVLGRMVAQSNKTISPASNPGEFPSRMDIRTEVRSRGGRPRSKTGASKGGNNGIFGES